MTEHYGLPLNILQAFTIAMSVVMLILILIGLFFAIRDKKKKPQPPPETKQETKPEQYSVCNNGWLLVARDAFSGKLSDEDKIAIAKIIGEGLPKQTRYMLCALSHMERADMVKKGEFFLDNLRDEQRHLLNDTRRGLTIGSAFFGYSIHPSMFLMDQRTRHLLEAYRRQCAKRYSYHEWLSRRKEYFGEGQLISQWEQRHHFTKEDVLTFYRKHRNHFEQLLLVGLNQHKLIPSMAGLVRSGVFRLGYDVDDPKQMHRYACALNVASFMLRVSIPLEWVMYSDSINAAQAEIYEEIHPSAKSEEKKHHLSLVINNAKYEHKYEF